MFDEHNVNEIIAEGRMVSSYTTGAGEMGFTMMVKSGTRQMFPRFTTRKELLGSIRDHARIVVRGHVEEFVKNINGTFYRERAFVADKVTPEKTLCEDRFDVKGTFFPDHMFRMNLSGRVTSVRIDPAKGGSWLRYKLDIGEDGKSLVIPSSLYILEGTRPPKIYEGDKACMVCTVSTPEKTGKDGKKLRYTDILVRDIALLDSSGRKKDHYDGETPEKEKKEEKPVEAPEEKKEKNVAMVVRKENIDKDVPADDKGDSTDEDLLKDLPSWARE